MTEIHKKNGALLLRDHLFRSPTLGCGKAISAFTEKWSLPFYRWTARRFCERKGSWLYNKSKGRFLGFFSFILCLLTRNRRDPITRSHNNRWAILSKWNSLFTKVVLTLREWCSMGKRRAESRWDTPLQPSTCQGVFGTRHAGTQPSGNPNSCLLLRDRTS